MKKRLMGLVVGCFLVARVQAAALYVDINGSNPVSPYNAWAMAATNIQDAVDASVAGDTVWVTNGVYATGERIVFGSMANRVVVDKAITVQSVNGPQATTIEGQGPNGVDAVRCVYLGDGALLSGFTLTNGHTLLATDLWKEESGGGVWSETSAVVSNCWIIGNSASSYGAGALYGTLNDCIISGNSGSRGSGASFAELNDCILKDNYASGWGGATYRGTLNRCVIQSNSAGDDAGGAYDGVLNNCVLSGNSAVDAGGGAYNSELFQCTVTGNSAAYGGGIYANGSGMDEVATNCIIWANSATKAEDNWGSLCQLAYSCTTPAHPGVNNIEVDPLLADAAHLSTNSPCIGAGFSGGVMGLDIDGEQWKTAPSMGCDEVYAGAIVGSLTPEITATFTNVVIGFVVDLAGHVEGHASQNIWDMDDGGTITNQLYLSHSWNTPGVYDLTFTSFNESNPAGVLTTLTITVLAQPIHYVDLNSATPTMPYNSWATAATNIQDAIDSTTVKGALVLVNDGTYNTGTKVIADGIMNRVAVDKPVVVRSVNGPQETTIEGLGPLGDSAVRCVYLGEHAVLSGFTLTGGYTRLLGDWSIGRAGGGVWSEGSALVTNCVITRNYSRGYGVGAFGGKFSDCLFTNNVGGEYSYGGGVAYATLKNCTLTDNMSERSGGGAYYCTLLNCTIDGNSAEYGGGAFDSILNGCTISDNLADDGGGVWESALTDCLVEGNSAEYGGGVDEGMLSHCVISNNTATDDGGGVMYGTLNYCTISDNTSVGSGGGLVYGDYNHCTITGNSADYGGGVRYGTLNSCLLVNNTADYGGGADESELYNCTIIDNSANFGGGITDSTLMNCIAWYNTSGDIQNSTSAFSCSPSLVHGATGNSTNAPSFVEWEEGNYRLLSGSPCIDVGDNAGATTATDLDGSPRIINSIVDMGAYEGAVDYAYYIMSSSSLIAVDVPIGYSPSDTSFEVWNLGESNMVYSISDNVSWLSCSPTNGSSTGEHDPIAVNFVDLSGFAIGAYTAQVEVVSAEANNSPRRVMIVVNVFDPVLDHFEWDTIPSPQTENIPLGVMVSARDQRGYLVTSFTNTADLSGLVLEDPRPDIEIGTGTSVQEFPMATYYEDERTQVIYLRDELGNACVLSGLALDVTSTPNMALNNWTIRMRHTPLAAYTNSPLWESDWTIVYQSTTTVPSTGWVNFDFDTPFEYNGTDNLMIDFSFNNDSYAAEFDGYCNASDSGTNRVLYSRSDSGDGDPLDWSGPTDPTPDTSQYVPNIKLTVDQSGDPVSISPTHTGLFVDGVWSGTVTVLEGMEDMVLRAKYGSSYQGDSNPFNVVVSSADPDSDGDGIPDWWELLYFGGITNCIGTDHADSDLQNNGEEYITGTDPTNGASFFGFTNAVPMVAGFVIQWDPSVSNREYAVSWTNDLSGTFTSLVSGIEFPQNSYTDTVHGAEGGGFYKVEVQLK